MEKGDRVKIFQKPFTEEDFEGIGKLLKKEQEDEEMEYWYVQFNDIHDRVYRWIKKTSAKAHR